MSPETFQFGIVAGLAGLVVGLCLGAGLMAYIADAYVQQIAKDYEDAR